MSGWTPERRELVAKLWQDGLSASQVAKALGPPYVSRNSVIGVIHRMGLSGRAQPSKPSKPNRIVNPRAQAKAFGPTKVKPVLKLCGNGVVFTEGAAPPPRAEIDRTKAFAPLPGSAPRPWTERRRLQCTWPIDTADGETLSCCLPTDGRAWCAEHAALGNKPAATAKSRGAEELARSLRRYL